MPTVILLDVSLSMCRAFKNPSSLNNSSNSGQSIEVRQLANVGIGTLLDYFAQNAQIEYTALLVYSSLWEIKYQFTRHHESIKNGIYDLELYDKSNIVNAVRGVLSLKLQDWTQSGPVNLILITDGLLYHDSVCNDDEQMDCDGKTDDDSDQFFDAPLSEIKGSFNFPCKMQIVCLASPKDPGLKHSIPFYKSLISVVDSTTPDCPVYIGSDIKRFKQSALWLPGSDSLDVSVESIESLFSKIAELHYQPFHSTLTCGHLYTKVMLSPRPTECNLGPLKNEYDDLKSEQMLQGGAKETYVSAVNKVSNYRLSDEFNICGFMAIKEIASPTIISRHLVLPILDKKLNETTKAEHVLTQDPRAYSKALDPGTLDESAVEMSGKSRLDKINRATNEHPTPQSSTASSSSTGRNVKNAPTEVEQDVTKQPSFCVLLHNSLKQENMVAICTIGLNDESKEEWYGMLHSHTDSKKRHNLMLSLLVPGQAPVLWLPSFRNLGSSSLNVDLPQSIRDKITSNRGTLKSYSSNNVIWLDPESVQADVQKIVRHAKRSPDKAPHFYKELNRIRRAAISYGFYDVLFGLAAILERERRIMSLDPGKSVSQEMLNHIDNVVSCLRADLTESSYETNITPKVLQ